MLISVSGKIFSGKDTTGQIINILLNSPHLNNEGVMTFLRKGIISKDNWQIKKFADKLKDIVCLLLGCSREDLENQEFKETVLGEEWWSIKKWYPNDNPNKVFTLIPYEGFDERIFDGDDCMWEVVKMTPRLMLQLMGTECGRQLIHTQIWVNSTFSDYYNNYRLTPKEGFVRYGDGYTTEEEYHSDKKPPFTKIEITEENSIREYPNWVITDCRFPNELEAVEKRNGVTIRVTRPKPRGVFLMNAHETVNTFNTFIEHISESALDSSVFQYEVTNNGTMEDLINKIRDILIKEGLL